MIDDTLDFHSHIDHIHAKSCWKLGAIQNCRNFKIHNIGIMWYKSLVLVSLDDCDIGYMETKQQNPNKLQLVQNIARCMVLYG